MSLQSQTITPVPSQTRQIAQATFPQGNRYMQLRDTLGTLYDDALFADLFPQRGQPAQAPWQLALVTLNLLHLTGYFFWADLRDKLQFDHG